MAIVFDMVIKTLALFIMFCKHETNNVRQA
jgi:hypothetical protein